jgi:hypothetical protein
MIGNETGWRTKKESLQRYGLSSYSKMRVSSKETPVASSNNTIVVCSINKCELSAVEGNPTRAFNRWRLGSEFLGFGCCGEQTMEFGGTRLMRLFGSIEDARPVRHFRADARKPAFGTAVACNSGKTAGVVCTSSAKKRVHSPTVDASPRGCNSYGKSEQIQ